jgi:hypothetical protein
MLNRNLMIALLIGLIIFIWLRNRDKQVSISTSTPNVTGYIMQYPSNADVKAAQEAYNTFLAQEANKIYTQQVLTSYMSIANQISNIVASDSEGAFTPNQIWLMESSDY